MTELAKGWKETREKENKGIGAVEDLNRAG